MDCLKERNTSNGQGKVPKMAKNTSKITTGDQAAVSKQVLNRSTHILLCSWSSLGPSSCQWPAAISIFDWRVGREIHFSKREAWLACAGRISAVRIGTEHSDNLGAAHTRSGGRKQPVCGVRLFLLGFKTALWNRVETATINDLHERVQSILEDYNLCQAGAVMVQFKEFKIRFLGDNQTSLNSGNSPVQDTPKMICTGCVPAWEPRALNSCWNHWISKMLWWYLALLRVRQCPLGKSWSCLGAYDSLPLI